MMNEPDWEDWGTYKREADEYQRMCVLGDATAEMVRAAMLQTGVEVVQHERNDAASYAWMAGSGFKIVQPPPHDIMTWSLYFDGNCIAAVQIHTKRIEVILQYPAHTGKTNASGSKQYWTWEGKPLDITDPDSSSTITRFIRESVKKAHEYRAIQKSGRRTFT